MKNFFKEYFPHKVTKKQSADTGMAMVLIFLILFIAKEGLVYIWIAGTILILNMIYPLIYYYVAIVWLGFANILGTVMSKLLLSVVFFTIVTPTAFIRRVAGKDSLKITEFKKGKNSVLIKRDYSFTAQDIEKPY